jgi:4-amino-4-deoxy-L-arabinose transferase-like glycosyltransferase
MLNMLLLIRHFFWQHRWLIVSIAGVVLAALPIVTYPLGRDQAMYANIGRNILAGGTPYIEMWDIKPPPIYYLYAAGIALFGTHWGALRAIDLVAFPLGAVGLYLIGLHLAQRRVGVWAVLLYGVFYFTETFASLTQNDSLVGILMIWAVFATLKASDTRRYRAYWAFLAGALSGLILWFKHYFVFFVLALVVFYLWRRVATIRATNPQQLSHLTPFVERGKLIPLPMQWINTLRRLFGVRGEVKMQREMVAFCLGGLLTGGGLLAYFASNGVFAQMLIVAQGTAAYNALGYDANDFLSAMQNYVYFRWRHWGALGLILLFGAGTSLMRRLGRRSAVSESAVSVPTEQPASNFISDEAIPPLYAVERGFGGEVQHWILYLWLLSGLAFLLIQAKGFDTHWLPLLPPLVVFAALSLDTSLQWVSKMLSGWRGKAYFLYGLHSLIVVGLGLILLSNTWLRALPYLTGQITLAEYYAYFPEGGDLNPVHSVQMVDYLRPKVAPGDTLYIWGFRPEVAYMGGWRPATRFQAQFPLVVPWFPAAWQQENVDTLWAAMPPYVLVLQGDYMPWVTGSHEDSHQLLVRYTELSNWLAANYERDTLIGSFIVWKKKLS